MSGFFSYYIYSKSDKIRSELFNNISTNMITIPPDFVELIIKERGDAGQKWLQGLPATFERLCTDWNLVIEGESSHGKLGIAVPVRWGSESLVLKVEWPDESTYHEIVALQTWDGRGAVKLFKTDPECGALLLERLDNTKSLESISIEEAVVVCGGLLRRLSIPSSQGLPALFSHAGKISVGLRERWLRQNKPFPESHIVTANAIITKLAPSAGSLLVDYDIHYGNVLRGTRESWLVIDPKVLSGDPEYALFPCF